QSRSRPEFVNTESIYRPTTSRRPMHILMHVLCFGPSAQLAQKSNRRAGGGDSP
ncbi:hypothetical protein CU097_004704, partial [Rhizopus azygosporus]